MGRAAAWHHLMRVTRPTLLLAPPDFIDGVRARLAAAGVQDAVARHNSAAIFDWLMPLVALQGISDAAALAFAGRHDPVACADIGAALADRPSCPRLRSYWHFACGYRKAAATCSEPQHLARCPLPQHVLRKGALNVASYGFFLFVRDVCGGDIVGWIDARLAQADPGPGTAKRARRMRAALLEPLGRVYGVGSKLWSMLLGDLLFADPNRERWLITGASMVAVDSVVHGYLARTGTLTRFGAAHPYGSACYERGGCADLINGLAQRIDAREFNRANPRYFPRFVEAAIWQFCAGRGWGICNGNQIDDRRPCAQRYCPCSHACDRVALYSASGRQ